MAGEAGQDAPAAKKKVVYGKKKAGPKKPSADAEAEAAREAELAAAEEAARKQAEEQQRVEEEQVRLLLVLWLLAGASLFKPCLSTARASASSQTHQGHWDCLST